MQSHEETMRLISEAKNGSEDAKTTLITENLPLIKSIVRRYRNRGTEYDDLMQLGSLGFLKAINNFDMSYDVRFSTYAVPMIMGEIKRFLRDDGYMKVSRAVKTLHAKVIRYIAETRAKGGEEPTPKQLAEHFGVEQGDIVFCLDAAKLPVSIYDKFDEDDERSQSMMDKLVGSDDTDRMIDRIALKSVMSALTDRERKIIILRYFRDMTQSEIAEYLGVSQVQVSRLEAKILKKLRENLS